MSEIDLEVGVPDDESPAERSRRRRTSRSDTGGGGKSRSSSSGSNREDASLVGRVDTALNKVADQMEAREDPELATALREESRAMSQGLVSLTATLTPLRPLLIVIMALAEPVLAFWRVGRILAYRFLAWRERRIVAAQEAQAQAEWEAGTQAGMPVTE